ncbi:MAG TPA: VWA domain-containing protein [Pyrinomonadaceae bacterium]|nr:VWA domain-containing protein [Pyrinomonadaceae bacterium]
MSILSSSIKSLLTSTLFCGCLAVSLAQEVVKTPPPGEPAQEPEDEVIKVNTALIQTGVVVLDKKGQFVGGLRLEDFELTVDGKPVPVSFFEQSTLRRDGGAKVERGGREPAASTPGPARPAGLGRNILFVVDDLHLSHDSHTRVRKLITNFAEREMTPDDTVAVVSSTGKLGFLQQFTNDRAVVRAVAERLIFTRDYSANDRSHPPMTEYEALRVSQLDPQVTDLFVSLDPSPTNPDSKRDNVRTRARAILLNAAAVSRTTYSTLERAVRSSARLPGRKIVFFISDGWLLDPQNSDATYRMRRITDAAARTNAVIYTFDPKGLEAGFPEGTTGSSPGIGFSVQSGERFDRQDGLSNLANETGGRFIRGTNDIQTGLAKSIDEASQYYLLAWQPVSADGGAEKWRKIDVKVRNRPELSVRMQGGFLDRKAEAGGGERSAREGDKGKGTQTAPPDPEQQLKAAANALTPLRTLPVSLAASYIDLQGEGTTVNVSLQIAGEAVEFTPDKDGQAKASIDLLCLIYDAQGKRVKDTRSRLTAEVAASALSQMARRDINHSLQAKLGPGLYQVRVGARDVKGGKVGSAVQWIEVPDLSARRLTLGSLILSERTGDAEDAEDNGAAGAGEANLRAAVDRRLARTSHLRYVTFIYNASRGKAGTLPPDVTVQTQVLRGQDVLITTQPGPVSAEGQDPARLAYAAEISLAELPPGSYELVVRVQDRIAKTDSAQRASFEIR